MHRSHQFVSHMLQCRSGIALLAQHMMDFINGNKLLEGVVLQINIVQRKIHIAHRADHCRMLPFRSKKLRQFPVGCL